MRREEAGQVSAFVVVFTLALLALAGLVLDGGYVLAAKRRAINEAEGAARAGAASLASAYRQAGPARLDPARAEAAARAYLAQTGHAGQVAVDGGRVSVAVSFDQPLRILGLGGLASRRVSGRAEARAVRGVSRAEP